MGSVHLARFFGPGGFRRIVAIKRLHPQYAEDAAFVSAFLDEARLASRIHHPNVVAPLDVIAENGEVLLVFEHVLGVSLSTLARRAKQQNESLPARVTARIMIDVLHGLQAAHEANGADGEALNLVHRDVSPQNILVGSDGSARLLDFGIAKAAGRLQTTDEGVVKGKRGYMAPEHLINATSQSSDIYSAAVILWEIITEQRLFPDDSSIGKRLVGYAAPLPSTLVKPPTSTTDASTLAVLDAITMRGLAFDVGARYATARDMAIALEAVGVASSREVGELVQRIAHEDIDERKELVAFAESTDGTSALSPSSTTSNKLASSVAAEPATIDVVISDVTPAQSRKRPLVAIGSFLILVLGGTLAFAFVKHRQTEGPSVTTATSVSSTASPDSSEAASSTPNSSGSAIAPVASASATMSTRAPEKPRGAGGHGPTKRNAAPCKPYVIDKDGHTQFNEACLR
jgi:serine/threonine-protein kinase